MKVKLISHLCNKQNLKQVNKILLVSASMINNLDATQNDEAIFQYTSMSSFRK